MSMGMASQGHEVFCLALNILLKGVKWAGWDMCFSIKQIDTGAFMSATSCFKGWRPPNSCKGGFEEWWNPKRFPVGMW